jgi:hypothetical protein
MIEFRNVLVGGDANEGEYLAKVTEKFSPWRPHQRVNLSNKFK